MIGQGHMQTAIGAVLSLSLAAAANANEVVIKGELDQGSRSFFESGVFGSIGADVFVGDQVSRRFAAARLGFDTPFTVGSGSGRVFVEAGVGYRSASIEQKRTAKGRYEFDPETGMYREAERIGPETRTLDVSTSGAELREAYVQYNPSESTGLSLGYQRPVWGQFDVVSPVNLLLPIEFQSNDLAWEKSSYRMPQPMISANLFATERFELNGYWFAGTNLDPLHEEILDEGGANTVYVAGDYGKTETRARPRKDFSDYHAGAARMVWYADGFTLGMTYYNGRNTLFASDLLPLVEPAVMQTRVSDGSTTQFDAYNVIDRTALPKSQAFGVEISIPTGRWTWKAEAFRMSTETDIGGLRPEVISRAPGEGLGEARRDLFQWILNENGGRAYADIDVLMMGAGFDALFDRWRFGAAAFTFNTSLGANAREANRLMQAAYPSNDEAIGTDTVWLPNFYLIRDFNDERTRSTGLLAGFAGPFLGVSAFYSSSLLDGWRWTASAEYAAVVSDEMLSDVNSDDDTYEIDNLATLGARIGFLYEF